MKNVPRRVSSERFIGRVDQLAVFDEVLVGAREGQGDVVLVSGEAGVGKSRFVAELTHRSRAAGAQVLTGWCVEHGEQIRPLAPIIDVLSAGAEALAAADSNDLGGPITRGLATLISEVRSVGGEVVASPGLTVSALLETAAGCLRSLSARGPVVAVIEDLHWADESTLRALNFLAPRMAGNPVVLVLTFRADELHRRHPLRPFIVSLERAVRPEQIELPPFTVTELPDLVRGITGRQNDAQFIRALHARSGGNAFYIEELLASGRSVGFPQILRDAILSRADTLDASASIVLHAAAAAGTRIDPEMLAVACARDPSEIHRLLEEIEATGLVVREDGHLRFRHELARETIEAELLPGDRAGVHAALAAALIAAAPERTGQIARHWMLAGDQPRALVASITAGRKAVSIGADAEALLQFERALELWDRVSNAALLARVARSAVLLDAADAAGRARRFSTALTYGRRALAELDGGVRVEIGMGSLRLTQWAWFAAPDSEILRLVDTALDTLPAEHHGAAHALAVAWHALLLTEAASGRSIDCASARARAHEALSLARACGGVQAEVHALVTIGVVTCLSGDSAGLDEIRRGLSLAVARGCSQEAGRAYNSLARWLRHFGQHDVVIGLEEDALEYCAGAGLTRVYGAMIEISVIRSLCRLGRWQDVENRVSALTDEFGGLELEHFTLTDSWGLVLVRQGRLENVADLIAQTFEHLSDHDSLIGPTTVTAVELAAAESSFADIPGLVEMALERILPRFDQDAAEVVTSAIGALADGTGPAHRAAADGRAADVQRAEGWLVQVERACEPTLRVGAIPTLTAQLTTARAELGRLRGELSTEQWRAAVSAWENVEAPYEIAYANWRFADALLKCGGQQSVGYRPEAKASLTTSRRIAVEIGAIPMRDKIDHLARVAHISMDAHEVVAGPADPDAGADHHGLTHRELEVLRLVAGGFTNGEIGQSLFISRKTASVHVSNILRKLGVSNRVEAATFLTKQDADGRPFS